MVRQGEVMVNDIADELVLAIQSRLLGWFANAQRCFPWRTVIDPYAVLVAEKLLQQTATSQVVVHAYEEILHKYPTIQSLAEASIQDLEAIIQPLGFRYRARELHTLAQAVIEHHAGQIPSTFRELITLPGIGDYIARAVLCFAFGKDVPVVDTNVARFLHRVLGLPTRLPPNPARKRSLVALANQLIPSGHAKEMNWAILDLAARICRPTRPKCDDCPMQPLCTFGMRGRIALQGELSTITLTQNVLSSEAKSTHSSSGSL